MPDKYTKVLARSLMKQLRENWRSDEINIQVAKSTVRVPLLELVDFERSEAAALVQKQKDAVKAAMKAMGDECEIDDNEDDCEELDSIVEMAKAHRTMEV
jgi:hypothetical protein